MKIFIWAAFGVLAVLWTLSALIFVELVQWSAQVIASGAAVELGRSAAQWPAPAWLALWLDPATINAAQEGLLTGFEAFRSTLPWVGSALGWLVPLVWIAWGIGVALLLAMTNDRRSSLVGLPLAGFSRYASPAQQLKPPLTAGEITNHAIRTATRHARHRSASRLFRWRQR